MNKEQLRLNWTNRRTEIKLKIEAKIKFCFFWWWNNEPLIRWFDI